MIGTIARGFHAGSAGVAERRPRRTLLDRYVAWLCRREDAARLREIEAREARDMGVGGPGAGIDRAPPGFVVDPRPLWGIGLTPQPMEAAPPRSARRDRHG